MHQIYASQAVSVTELKRSYAAVIADAEGEAVAVLNNNKPEAYLIPAEAYEQLIDRLEDMEDALTVLARQHEPSVEVSLDALKHGNI